MTDARDFDAFFVYTAFSRFAGAEDDEVGIGQGGHALDGGDAEFFAVAED